MRVRRGRDKSALEGHLFERPEVFTTREKSLGGVCFIIGHAYQINAH